MPDGRKKRGILVKTEPTQSVLYKSLFCTDRVIANWNEIEEQAMPELDRLANSIGKPLEKWTETEFRIAIASNTALQPRIPNERNAGRKITWTNEFQLRLWLDVFSYQLRNPSHSLATACRNVAKETFWRSTKMNSMTIEKAYGKYVKPHALKNGYSKKFARIYLANPLNPDHPLWDEILSIYRPPLKKGL